MLKIRALALVILMITTGTTQTQAENETEVKNTISLDRVEHQGQKSIRINTPTATWIYHEQGAGFASLIDKDGHDWISYRPKGGADGKFRGIPNLVHPAGHFHPGSTSCKTKIVSQTSMRVVIESESKDGKWACQWEILPDRAHLTVTEADAPYWFLYEGTPGGESKEGGLDTQKGFCVRSGGKRTDLTEKWTDDLASDGGSEWVGFGNTRAGRTLVLINHGDDTAVDSYWPMEGNMTVFGFGRKGLNKHLKPASKKFTVALVDQVETKAIAEAVAQLKQPTEAWLQLRGPLRDGHSSEESGWPDRWPPTKAWQVEVGEGSTSPIIAGGQVYVAGWRRGSDQKDHNPKGKTTIYCLDLKTGEELWTYSIESRRWAETAVGDQRMYSGALGTPTFDQETGLLFFVNTDGHLLALNTKQEGQKVWSMRMRDKNSSFTVPQRPNVGGGQRDYGFTNSPLLYKEWVLVEVGASSGTLVAFDKKSGKVAWQSQYSGPAGHTSGPVLIKADGKDAVALLTLKDVVIIDVSDIPGRTLVTHKWQTDYGCNIPSPCVVDATQGDLLITSGYNHKQLARLRYSKGKIEEVWSGRSFATVATPLVMGDRAFTLDHRLKCIDLANGKERWVGGRFGHGSMLAMADNKLLVFGNGQLGLIDAKDNEYRELHVMRGILSGDCYPHIAFADGFILCKNSEGRVVALRLK